MLNTPPYVQTSADKEHYSSLDGLRSYSAIAIIIMHVRANMHIIVPGGAIIGAFSDFVLLFMMISAFSMCCGYYDKVKNGTIKPLAFYKKRYFRILPYFLFLCLIDLVIHPSIISLYELFTNATLCYGLLPNPAIGMIGMGWFIGIIFLFYLLFPFFVFMMDTKRSSWISLMITLVFAYIAIAHFYKPPFVQESPRMHNIIYCTPFFVIGGIIYLNRERIVEWGRKYLKLLTIAVVALSLLFFYSFLTKVSENGYGLYIVEFMMYSIWLLYAICSKDRFLNNKFTKFISGISLEIYLAHMVIFRGVELMHIERYISNEITLLLVTVIIVLISVVAFTYVTKYYMVDKVVSKLTKTIKNKK